MSNINEYNLYYEAKINLKYKYLFNLLSEKIIDTELLTKLNDMIKEDTDIEKYLILKYYKNYHLDIDRTGYIDENKITVPIFPEIYSERYWPTRYAKKILDHIIKQKTQLDSNPDTQFVILVPGDSPSKIVSFILLIDEYVKLLKDHNINIIQFKLFSSSRWNQETLKEYIKDLLKNYNKENIHIGLIDAISHERKTIISLNNILKLLG